MTDGRLTLSRRAVADTLTVPVSTLDDLRRTHPTFPRPVTHTPLLWRAADIAAWVAGLEPESTQFRANTRPVVRPARIVTPRRSKHDH